MMVKTGTFWPRAEPGALASFDPSTKQCTHNCGPAADDPRSDAERKLLCDLCDSEQKGGA